MVEYSIVICSYNPDIRLLERCLKAIQSLAGNTENREVILVDNNSSPKLESLPLVQQISKEITNMSVLVEDKQGIYYARRAGIKKAKGEFIVFFDDDNEVHSDYLHFLGILRSQYNMVGAWGPGNVWVDFIDGISSDIELRAADIFQEKHETFVHYACLRRWVNIYPFGTGLCIKKSHATAYVKMVDEGTLSFRGRKKNLLTSGDDTQLVLCCILNGEAAGTSPDLKINHIIPAQRANFSYLKRLVYSTHLGFDASIKEVIPEHEIYFGRPIKSNWRMSFRFFKKFIKILFTSRKEKHLDFVTDCALLQGAYIANGRETPRFLNFVIKYLNLHH